MSIEKVVGPKSDVVAQARTLAANPMVMINEVTGLDSTREFVDVLADEIERLRRESGVLAKRADRRQRALSSLNVQLASVHRKFKRMSHERDLLKGPGDGYLLAENQKLTVFVERVAAGFDEDQAFQIQTEAIEVLHG